MTRTSRCCWHLIFGTGYLPIIQPVGWMTWSGMASTRTRQGVAFAELFTPVVGVCGKAGLVSLGWVALDGRKVPAAANRDRATSYDPMARSEARLSRRQGRLAESRTAKAALEAEHGATARAKAEQQAATRGDDPAQVAAAGDAAEASAMVPDNASWTPPMAIS